MNCYALQTKGLTKKFGKVIALNDMNINIPKGSIFGLIGVNGAGKTTLFRIIAGLSEKTSGDILLFGQNNKNTIDSLRKKVGFTIEDPALYSNMSVYDNLKLKCIIYNVTYDKINEVLDLVDLNNQKNMKTKKLSYGMKQRLAIGLALINSPNLLILDEPTNGLDPISIVEMRKLFKKLIDEKDLTILIASHMLSELEHLATHFGIIHNGKLIKEITSEDLLIKCKKYLKINVSNTEKSLQLLKNIIFQSCNVW